MFGEGSMARFGKPVWGWMFFDWAAQPYFTLLLTFIFAPYFASAVVADEVMAQQYWGWMLTGVGIAIAILAPILGSVADASGSRLNWILGFSILSVAGSASLWWAYPNSDMAIWILVAFGIGLIGVEFTTIFTNAMLPDLGTERDMGIISGSGWAFGYAGGLVSLAIAILLLAENDSGVTLLGTSPILGLDPEAREGTRAVGPLAACWYVAFMIPFFLWVRDGSRKNGGQSLSGLAKTIRTLPRNTSLLAYLGSSMFYRDALNGLFAFGGIYAVGVLDWTIVQIGIFGILSLVFGAAFSWIGGLADGKFGPKPVILTCLTVLTVVCVVILFTSRTMVLGVPVNAGSGAPDILFMICGCVIGAAGGSVQAASRTMMVIQAERERMTEAFGLYALAGKATSFLAPMLIAVVTGISGDQRIGVSPLVFLFLIGIFLLKWVKKGEYGHARN